MLAEANHLTAPISATGATKGIGTSKEVDHRTAAEGALDGVKAVGNSTLVGTVSLLGGQAKSNQAILNDAAHNAGTNRSSNLFSAVAGTIGNIVMHPQETVSGISTAVKGIADNALHGTAGEKGQAWGEALTTVALIAAPNAGRLAKLGTEGKALGVAQTGLEEANLARLNVAGYREATTVARTAAQTTVEDLAAARAAKTVSTTTRTAEAVEATAPVATTGTSAIAPKFTLPKIEPAIKPNTFLSNLTGGVKETYRYLGSDAVAGESTINRFTTLKAETPTLKLSTRVDGLVSGEGAPGMFHPGERYSPSIKMPRPAGTAEVVATDATAGRQIVKPNLNASGVVEEQTVGRTVVESKPGQLAPETNVPKVHSAPEINVPKGQAVLETPGGKVLRDPAGTPVENITGRGPDGVVKTPERIGNAPERVLNTPERIVNAPEKAIVPTTATTEAPAIVAGKAETHIEGLTRIVSEKGINLPPQVTQSLEELSTQLKTVARSGETAVPTATREAIARNMATIEEAVVASGTDSGLAAKFQELKTTVRELTPAVEATVTSTPATVALKAESHIEGFTRLTEEQGVNLTPQAKQSLTDLTADMKTIAQSGESVVPTATREAISRNIATIEESVVASGDAGAAAKLNELKATVREFTPPSGSVATTAVPVTEVAVAPAVSAAKAGQSVDAIASLTGEGRVVLSQEAEQSLQALNTQLKTIATSGSEGTVSLAVRNEMAENVATLERSLAKTGADPIVARQLTELKTAINEMAPSRVAPITPVTEAPVVLATRAAENVEALTQTVSTKGLNLGTEAEQSLANINTQLKVVAEGGAPLTVEASTQLTQDIANVERAVIRSGGADATVTTAVNDLKTTVNDLTRATVEREQMAAVRSNMTTLEANGSQLSTNVQKLVKEVAEAPAATAADQRLTSTISNKLEAIEQKLTNGALTETPITTTSEIQTLVRDLERPEYSRFFAENPNAARALEEVKASTSVVVNTSTKVETAQLGIAKIRDAEAFQAGVDGLATTTRELRTASGTTAGAATAAEVSEPVATALKNIESDLATIKTGANPESVMRNVQANIEQIESAGATNIAKELKQGLGELENTSTVMDRTRRIESAVSTIQTESAVLETRTGNLSKAFADEAVTAPSTTAAVPVNAQVSEQLQFISRQSKLIDAGEAGTTAVTRIKEAFTKIEDLTAGETLTAQQSAALREIKASINTIDQASVEATGLRRFETNTARIGEQAGRVETITGRIAQSEVMTSQVAVDAQLEQKLANINSAAREVTTAKTLDEQITALNKLTTAVSEPELQTVLGRTKTGARAFEELQATSAELHESVSYRALERYKIVAEAEAENAATAARALESRIKNDVALSSSPSLQTAATDYRTAAEAYAKAPDKTVAAAQMQQKLEVLQTELKATTVSPAITQGDEIANLTRAHNSLTGSVADGELMTRRLIDRRLPVVESGFDQIGAVGSSVVQREIMKDLTHQLQNMRYLEARSGAGAEALENAQMQLTKAQNDLEVATYRRNLVKLAASGDQAATDRLLISGLTSDGYRASAMASGSGPAARLIEDFVKNRTSLYSLFNKGEYTVGKLAAYDPLFINNSGLLSARVIRNTSYTIMGAGGVAIGVGGYLNARDRAAAAADSSSVGRPSVDRAAADSATTPVKADAAVTTASSESGQNAATLQNASLQNVSGDAAANRVVGRSASEPQGFTPNGQTVARRAYTQETQALPRNAAALNGANFSAMSDAANEASLGIMAQPTVSVGQYVLSTADPSFYNKAYAVSYSGNPFGARKGSDPAPEPEAKAPFMMAQTFKIKSGPSKMDPLVDLNRPGSTQFPKAPYAMANPMALGLGTRRDVIGGRAAGGNFVGSGSTTTASRTGDASMQLASFSEVDAEEGGTGAGVNHLKNVERTEASGLDSNAAHSGGAAVNAKASNIVNHDDDDEGPDPAGTGTSVTAKGPVAGGGDHDQSPAAGGATTSNTAPLSRSGVGVPPRKRADKGAISA